MTATEAFPASRIDCLPADNTLLFASDMRKYTFHYCTTTEGVAFKVNEISQEIWKGYYYLGYESEATCESD